MTTTRTFIVAIRIVHLPARRQAELGERRDEDNVDTPSERETKGGKQEAE